ncbi:MAG TPA: flagellar type III secretion system pore protein FliP [bacterium]|nr:flagellar type III secretion system pore protein FliP [bacterium]
MPSMPPISLQLGSPGAGGGAPIVELMLLLTLLSFAPAILIMFTSFVRIVVVLSLLRNAIGAPTVPPNMVVTGLALVLTMFTMAPTFRQIDQTALQPYMAGKITIQKTLDLVQPPIRAFMFRQTHDRDVALFQQMAHLSRPATQADVPTYVLVPAFVTSELSTAFVLGTLVFLPFVVIDLVVSSTLLSLGMFMLPPTVISLPVKLLLFVLTNGWDRVVGGLVASVH